MWTKTFKSIFVVIFSGLLLTVVYGVKSQSNVERFILSLSHTDGGTPITNESTLQEKKLYACADIVPNTSTYISFVWIKDGSVIKKRTKEISNPKKARHIFRFSSILPSDGQWSVKLVDDNHTALKEISFSIKDQKIKILTEEKPMGIVDVLKSIQGEEPAEVKTPNQKS